MINKTFLLLRAQLINQFNPRKARENKMVLIAYACLIMIIVGYSGAYGLILGMAGMGDTIPSFALFLGSIMSLFFTMFKTNSVIFASGDYDRLMSLPITEANLIASRFLSIYIINSLFMIGVMLPMGIAHQAYTGVTWYGCITWILGMALGSLIPTTLATALGALVTFIASKFRHSKMVSTFLGLFFLVLVLMGSFAMMGVDESKFDSKHLMALGKSITQMINKAYPVAGWFSSGVKGEVVPILLFVLVSITWFLLFVWLLSLRYQNIHTALTAKYSKGNYQMEQLKTASPLVALFKREMKHYFSCSVYLQNTAVGGILAVIGAASIVIVGPMKIAAQMGIPGVESYIGKVLPFAISAILAMSCTTSSSLSLEGKNAWILQSLPIRTKDIAWSKILVNLVIDAPFAIVCGVLLTIAWHESVAIVVANFIIPIVFTLFCSVWGLAVNYKFLRLDWETEVQVVKQSMASFIGMFGGLLMGAILLGLVIISSFVPFAFVLFVVVLVLLLATGGIYYFIISRKGLFHV